MNNFKSEKIPKSPAPFYNFCFANVQNIINNTLIIDIYYINNYIIV